MPPLCAALWIPGPLPGLNDMIAKQSRARGFRYEDLKEKWTNDIAMLARSARVPHFSRVHIDYLWVERNHKRDPSNIAAGGRKLVEDGLVAAKVLDNDGWEEIDGWLDSFVVDKAHPGVLVKITGKYALHNTRKSDRLTRC